MMNQNEMVIYKSRTRSIFQAIVIGGIILILGIFFFRATPEMPLHGFGFFGQEIGFIWSTVFRVISIFGMGVYATYLPRVFNDLFRLKPSLYLFDEGFKVGFITKGDFVPWNALKNVDWEYKEKKSFFIKHYDLILKLTVNDRKTYLNSLPWVGDDYFIFLNSSFDINFKGQAQTDIELTEEVVKFIKEKTGLD